MRYFVLPALVVIAWPQTARADDRARVLSAVKQVSELGVCFAGKRPKTVRIELRVAKSGKVTRARAKTKGAVAQCVAGVLAVRTLTTRGAASVTIDVPTSRAGRAGTGSGAEIDSDLRRHASSLNACYDAEAEKRPKLKGRVVLRFLVTPKGKILEPEVQSSTLGSAAVEKCLIKEFEAITVSARPSGKTMSMSLSLVFDGAGKSGATMTSGNTSNQPQKRGPMSGKVISRVMNTYRDKFSACYDKVARTKPSLSGKVVIRFTIRPNGTVRNVKIRETTLDNSKVENCMVGVGKTLRFPSAKVEDTTKVWYPFVFSQTR